MTGEPTSRLLFIGGAARTGKGILVRRLLVERQMPYLSLDVLKMGLARGVPEFPIDPNAGGMVVGERLWPLVREMSASLLRDDVDYAIEGELLPKHVAALRDAHPAQVKACFLGYTAITPADKLHNIRTHGGYPNDWAPEYTDPALLTVITSMMEFSRYLKRECAAYDLPYFDTSDNFTQTLDQVVAYVVAGRD
ncbi:MAG: hypothetical protein IPK52_13560 [Chloroflexi bacterium]|nr:hypothetical protein [Chloroflexota bacterium]